jgi:hypothetical protein
MTKLIAATTLTLMLASAAHAEAPCWAYVMKGDNLICELRGPTPAGTNYRAGEHSGGQGPGTFSPNSYPSAPTTIRSRSTVTIRSYRQ